MVGYGEEQPELGHVSLEEIFYIPDITSRGRTVLASVPSAVLLKNAVVQRWITQQRNDKEITESDILTRAKEPQAFPDLWSMKEKEYSELADIH